MSALFKKLNLKDQTEVVVIDAPASFEAEIAALEGIAVRRSVDEVERVQFSLAFVTRQEQINQAAAQIVQEMDGDVVVWFAYPKGSSKRYTCDFNRDTGWDSLGAAGFEPVRQVAIDEDWSALRFRRVEYIKKLTRSNLGAISETGKQRIAQQGENTPS